MCAHVFNTEVEYIDNCVLNLKRKLSKKMLKKGYVLDALSHTTRAPRHVNLIQLPLYHKTLAEYSV